MFVEKDLIMRAVKLATEAILRAKKLRKSGDETAALDALDDAIEREAGIPKLLLSGLADSALIEALTSANVLDVGRAVTVGLLLSARGDVRGAAVLEAVCATGGDALLEEAMSALDDD